MTAASTAPGKIIKAIDILSRTRPECILHAAKPGVNGNNED